MAARVFLDLDGTLTDPAVGITRSIRHALAALGRPVPPERQLTWCIGPPLQDSLMALLDGDTAMAARALALYRERFAAVGIYENAVHTGIQPVLADLSAAGLRLYVATSKPHVYARQIVTRFGFDRWVSGVFGAELDGIRAHKPELLAHALAVTGGAAPNGAPAAVMVGDRRHDIAGARANGIRAVGVLWGYGDRAELVAAGADRIVATPAELAPAVRALVAT